LDLVDPTEMDINGIQRAGHSPLIYSTPCYEVVRHRSSKRQSKWWTFAPYRLFIWKLLSV